MRIPRSVQLCEESGVVHKYWRAHNREYILSAHKVKILYLQALVKGITHRLIKGKVKLHAYCVMSNHAHEVVSYEGQSTMLSLFMKLAHSWFGYMFNRLSGREGTFLSGRTKTPLIQNIAQFTMKTHFYIEANPLRAGMIKDLKQYPYSSFRFYAWGIVDEFSKYLTAPNWYLNLGKNALQRQSRYRALFNKYLRNSALTVKQSNYSSFQGQTTWVSQHQTRIKTYLQKIRHMISKAHHQDHGQIDQQFF